MIGKIRDSDKQFNHNIFMAKNVHVKYIILLKINKTKAAKILGLLY